MSRHHRGARGLSAAPWFTSLVTVILLLAMLGAGGWPIRASCRCR
jgi:hypothetical protein